MSTLSLVPADSILTAVVVANDAGPAILMVLFGVFMVGAVIYGAIQERKRREELLEWSQAGGFDWSPGKRKLHSSYALFQKGHSRYGRYFCTRFGRDLVPGLERARDYSEQLFEYHYAITTSDGKRTRTSHYYFACIEVCFGMLLGDVSIRSEGFMDRLGEMFGSGDIDFEDAEFSSRFHVQSPDRRRTYELIHTGMMRFLMLNQGKLVVHIRGDRMLVYRTGRADVADFVQLLGFIEGFCREIPRTIVNEDRARRGLPPLIQAGAAAG